MFGGTMKLFFFFSLISKTYIFIECYWAFSESRWGIYSKCFYVWLLVLLQVKPHTKYRWITFQYCIENVNPSDTSLLSTFIYLEKRLSIAYQQDFWYTVQKNESRAFQTFTFISNCSIFMVIGVCVILRDTVWPLFVCQTLGDLLYSQ